MTTPQQKSYGSTSTGTSDSVDPESQAVTRGLDNVKLLNWCQQEYKRCKDVRAGTENQWYLNLAFYAGKQNVRQTRTPTSSTGWALSVPPAPPWRVRLVVNKIRPMIRTLVAKCVAQKPMFSVVPATTEDEDLAAARVGEQIFDSVYSDKNVKRVIRRAAWWASICGSAYIKCYWDPTKLDVTTSEAGDFCIEHITPFHVLVPDLREEELENQPYIIHMTMKSAEWVKRTYGKSVTTNGTKSYDDILQAGFLNLIDTKVKVDEVLSLEFWIKPGNPLLPGGGLVTVIGDQIVQVVDGYPYEHEEFPFMKIDSIPSGKFYADSVIGDLIGIQREYNRTRSQMIEYKNTMSKPKLIAARGSIDPNKITSEPGQAILFQPGFPAPVQMQLVPMPQHIMDEVIQLQNDMDDISGQHDISRGKNPAQVTAATALSFLQEQDDTKLSDTIGSIEEAVEKLGRQILSHVTQYWTAERTVKIVGKDGSFDAQRFKAADLGGNHDVRVQAGSALPQSKAAKQAFLMDLMKLGIIPPEKGLEMLDLGGIEKVYEDYLVDVRQAQRENQKLSAGIPLFSAQQALTGPPTPFPMDPGVAGAQDPTAGLPVDPAAAPVDPSVATGFEPNTWDNHQVHIDVHNKFRKSQEFEQLPDDVKAKFKTHVELHQSAIGLDPLGHPLAPPMGVLGQSPAPNGNGAPPVGAPPASGQPPMPLPPMGQGGPPPPMG